jgi:hypothetical protein
MPVMTRSGSKTSKKDVDESTVDALATMSLNSPKKQAKGKRGPRALVFDEETSSKSSDNSNNSNDSNSQAQKENSSPSDNKICATSEPEKEAIQWFVSSGTSPPAVLTGNVVVPSTAAASEPTTATTMTTKMVGSPERIPCQKSSRPPQSPREIERNKQRLKRGRHASKPIMNEPDIAIGNKSHGAVLLTISPPSKSSPMSMKKVQRSLSKIDVVKSSLQDIQQSTVATTCSQDRMSDKLIEWKKSGKNKKQESIFLAKRQQRNASKNKRKHLKKSVVPTKSKTAIMYSNTVGSKIDMKTTKPFQAAPGFTDTLIKKTSGGGTAFALFFSPGNGMGGSEHGNSAIFDKTPPAPSVPASTPVAAETTVRSDSAERLGRVISNIKKVTSEKQNEVDELKNKVDTLKNENDQLTITNQKFDNMINEYESKYSELEEENNNIVIELQSLRKMYNEQVKNNGTNIQQISDLEKEIDQINENYEQRLLEIEVRCGEAEEDAKNSKNEICRKNKELLLISEEATAVKEEYKTYQLKVQMNENTFNITNNESKKEIIGLNHTVDQLKMKINAMREQIKHANDKESVQMEKMKSVHVNNMNELNETVKQLTVEKETIFNELNELENETSITIQNMEKKITSIQHEHEITLNKIEEANQKICKGQKVEINKLREQINKLKENEKNYINKLSKQLKDHEIQRTLDIQAAKKELDLAMEKQLELSKEQLKKINQIHSNKLLNVTKEINDDKENEIKLMKEQLSMQEEKMNNIIDQKDQMYNELLIKCETFQQSKVQLEGKNTFISNILSSLSLVVDPNCFYHFFFLLQTEKLKKATNEQTELMQERMEMEASKDNEFSNIQNLYNGEKIKNSKLIELITEKDIEIKSLRSNIHDHAILEKKCISLSNQCNVYKSKIKNAEILRRTLHNQVMDLRGSIRVGCRVRPILLNEMDASKSYGFPDSQFEQRKLNITLAQERFDRTASKTHVRSFC